MRLNEDAVLWALKRPLVENNQYNIKNNSHAKCFIFFEISHRFDNQITYQLLQIQFYNIFI